MAKISLGDIANLQNESSVTGTINANNSLIETAIENTLSRDGSSPNSMNSDFDMNSHKILNLPAATVGGNAVEFDQYSAALNALTNGAVVNAQYVTLANNGTLQNERVLTAGSNIGITDGGAGSTVTVAINNAEVNALGALASTGVVARTGTATYTPRTVTGTANEITVNDGDGVAANPTISLPAALTYTGKTVTGGTYASPTINTPVLTVNDASFTLQDNVDNTKKVNFELSSISTGATRVLTLPNATDALVARSSVDTLSNKTFTGSTNTFGIADNKFSIQDDLDATKQGNFQLSALTTGNTRTLTWPDANTTIAGTDATQTLTNKTISGASNTLSNVALSSLSTQAANTLVANSTGSAASPTAVDISTLTLKASPAGTDLLLLSDQAASGALKRVTVSGVAGAGSVSSIDSATGAFTTSTGVKTASNVIMVDGTFTSRNRIINPSGQIAQQALGSTADGIYNGFDQWLNLNEANPTTSSSVTNAENGTPYMMRNTQSNVTAQRFGTIQWLENNDCIDLRGQAVVLSARVRMSASTTLRYAIVEWTGTADTITKDIVLTWSSTTFTPGNFFTSTSTAITATGSTALTANTLTNISLTGTVGSSCNNLAVFFWTDSQQAQNVTLDVGKVMLEVGITPSTFAPRKYEEELRLCQRLYLATPFPVFWENVSVGVGGNTVAFTVPFPVPMRVTPTITQPTWSTGGVGTVTTGTVNTYGVFLSASSNVAANSRMFVQYASGNLIANARL